MRHRIAFDEREVSGDKASREVQRERLLDRAIEKVKLSPVAGGGTGDMSKATYDTDNDGIVDLSENVVLSPDPGAMPPTAGNEGKFFYRRPGGGAPSTLHFCIMNSGGALEWIFVGLSS